MSAQPEPDVPGPAADTVEGRQYAMWVTPSDSMQRSRGLVANLDRTLDACWRAVRRSRSLRNEAPVKQIRAFLLRSRFHADVYGSLVAALQVPTRPLDWRAGLDVVPGQLRLLPDRQSVELASGRRCVLTRTEWQLLNAFLARPGRVLSRGELASHAWGSTSIDRSSEVEVYISRLRRKIEANPQKPRIILTVRGAGYKLNPGDGLGESWAAAQGHGRAGQSTKGTRASGAGDQSAVEDSSTPG